MKKRQRMVPQKIETPRHPGAGEEEIFIGNVASPYAFSRIGWETARKGGKAYGKDNQTVIYDPKVHPVFIRKQEAVQKYQQNVSRGITNPGWLIRILQN